jgi:RNA polymerase sigma-70 factor (ECF subfamily)
VVPVAPTFREIFDAHDDYLWSSLRRLGVRAGDLDDVVDEVFLRIHASLDRYDPSRPIKPWLFAFAVRAASDYRRLARHRREQSENGAESADSAPNPEDAALTREALGLVQIALDALGDGTRPVFIAYEIDGADMKDIAETLRISLNTAYSRLRLARAAFAAKMRALRGEEEARPTHE